MAVQSEGACVFCLTLTLSSFSECLHELPNKACKTISASTTASIFLNAQACFAFVCAALPVELEAANGDTEKLHATCYT
jgi:hypothetical protein